MNRLHVLVALAVGLVLALEALSWRECRQVGHSVGYCVLNIGHR